MNGKSDMQINEHKSTKLCKEKEKSGVKILNIDYCEIFANTKIEANMIDIYNCEFNGNNAN